MLLKEISQISIGILKNREFNKEGKNKYEFFNLKDYEENTGIIEVVKTDKDFEAKKIKKGDLIFRLIYPNKVILVDDKIQGMLIPSQWCLIRLDENLINPTYLKWYLESEDGKNQILTNITGSTIQKIPVDSLRNLDIPLIDIKKQNNIEDLIKLWEREKRTIIKILENKELLYNDIIREIIEKEVK